MRIFIKAGNNKNCQSVMPQITEIIEKKFAQAETEKSVEGEKEEA